jgi:hypothetical protein
MSFSSVAFFDGFTRYLREERAKALQFLAVTASFEHWIQFEAGAWINENRAAVGLDSEHWWIALELRKGDTWLVNRVEPPSIGIEFKGIHNNKNCRGKVWELRRDLSVEKVFPRGFRATIRSGSESPCSAPLKLDHQNGFLKA